MAARVASAPSLHVPAEVAQSAADGAHGTHGTLDAAARQRRPPSSPSSSAATASPPPSFRASERVHLAANLQETLSRRLLDAYPYENPLGLDLPGEARWTPSRAASAASVGFAACSSGCMPAAIHDAAGGGGGRPSSAGEMRRRPRLLRIRSSRTVCRWARRVHPLHAPLRCSSDASTSRALALAADAAAGIVLSEDEVWEMLEAAEAVLLREDTAALDEEAAAARRSMRPSCGAWRRRSCCSHQSLPASQRCPRRWRQ